MKLRGRPDSTNRDKNISTVREFVIFGEPMTKDALVDMARHPETLESQVEDLEDMVNDAASRTPGSEDIPLAPEAAERLGKLCLIKDWILEHYGRDEFYGQVSQPQSPAIVLRDEAAYPKI